MLPKINKKSSIPSYLQIKEHFQNLIEDNILKAGDKIPSEQEIVQTTKLSRMTVRQGIQQLVQLGYLRTKQGLGTFVVGQISELDSLNFCTLNKGFHAFHKNSSHKIINHTEKSVNEKLSKILEVEATAQTWYTESVRYIDDVPMVYEESHLSQNIFSVVTPANINENKYSWIQVKSSQNIMFSKKQISPMLANEELAEIFNIAEGTAIIKMEMSVYLDDYIPCEHTTLYFHPEYPLNIVQIFRD